ncbi:putative palmitoyltransferase ZDHHC8 [Arapaima gigas]
MSNVWMQGICSKGSDTSRVSPPVQRLAPPVGWRCALSSLPDRPGGTTGAVSLSVPPEKVWRMPSVVGKPFKPTTLIPVSSAAALLVGSSTLFFVFTCPWLTQTISLAVPLYNGIVFLFVLANFSMATFMDSGVFPRATEEEDTEDDFRAPLYKNVEVKGIQVRMKWCASCHFYRPPRCSHCSVCDHCVEDFDHHCPWVNNCIGRRNYRYFFLFLLSLCVHMVGVFSFGLLFVLHHLECLEALHTTITMVVMCVSGLFFIPVGGLTGFHMVLVARGRTTNEQVTGKFKGGVNPFTRGCCGNIEYVLCSPLAPRYMVDHRKKPSLSVQPPFLHPEVSERQITFKLRENRNNDILRTKSKCSLNLLDPQLPLAPRTEPDEEYELSSGLGESKGLSAQALRKYQPSFAPLVKMHYCAAREQQVARDQNHQVQDCFSELDLELSDWQNQPVHWAFRGSPMQLDTYSLHSRSLSLRESHQHRERLLARPTQPEACTPYTGTLIPGSLFSRNGSLSYDSLLSPTTALPSGECLAYVRRQHPPIPTGNLFLGGRQSPCPGDQLPTHYDSLSRAAMASIQERRETEEKDCLLGMPDSSVYDTPRVCSLQPGPCYAEGRLAPRSRSPTPPTFASRDNLLGARPRAPCLPSSSQSSMTSVTSVHTDRSGSGVPVSTHHSHGAQSTCSTPPHSPTYISQKRLSIFSASGWMDSAPPGEPKA